jgi:hypothetical protein
MNTITTINILLFEHFLKLLSCIDVMLSVFRLDVLLVTDIGFNNL